MVWGVRLDIRSGIIGGGTPDVSVPGGTLVLERLGAAGSKAKRGASVAAQIVFHAAFLEKARNVSEPEYSEFATLSGQVVLDENTGRPLFVCEADGEIAHAEPEPDEDDRVRHVALGFDESTFRDAPRKGSAAALLRLPAEPEGARFFELGVELKLDGAVEATRAANGRLDVPLGPEKLESTMPLEQLEGVARLMNRRHFAAWMTSIFGFDVPHSAYLRLHAELVGKRYPMPRIEIVKRVGDSDFLAGFDRDRKLILVRRSFVKKAETDEQESAVLMAALLEEFGHFVDDDLRTRLSRVGGDAELDEGARFGYAICNLGWDLKDSEQFATYVRDGARVPLSVRWTAFKQSIDRVLGPEQQRSDDMQLAIEFFGAGRGNADAKPGQSFAHESIEDILNADFPDAKIRKQIYFGNWLRDFSQAITPTTLELLSTAASIIDKTLPGTNPSPRLKNDPRGVLTDILDIYARADFADLPEFRVTRARLGVYRSEEHIDNPTNLKDSAFDPGFDKAPTEQQKKIDSQRRAAYIAQRLTRPAKSAAEYMREEFSAAIAAGPTPEGRRRFGQGLHTLEDFYAHSNFCELALRAIGKVGVEPWTIQVTSGGKTFFPLVTGIFGGDDTAASIFLALGEILERDMDKPCEAGARSMGVRIALVLLRDLRPHIAKQAEGALDDIEGFKKEHPVIFTLMCRTIGMLMKFLNWLMGALVRLIANQIDEYQVFTNSAPSLAPTHTQIAKDHDDHPLHQLAGQCAQSAVKDIGHRMAEIWGKPAEQRAALTQALLDRAESYFVHPDLVVTSPGPPDSQVTIINIVRSWANDPKNQAAIVRSGKRTVLDEHLREAEEFGKRVTDGIPIERLKEIFGL